MKTRLHRPSQFFARRSGWGGARRRPQLADDGVVALGVGDAGSLPSRAGLRGTGIRGGGARGSVVLIVLVSVVFASAALLVFMEKAGNDLLVETREADARRMRMEAYSALETTLAVLEDFRVVNGGLRSPAEGWSDPLAFAGYEPSSGRTVKIEFEDESGKLSLPATDSAALVVLFKGWGLEQRDAENLSDALLGWMKPDYVPMSAGSPRPEDYDRGDLPYAPPARSLRSYSELSAIQVARDVFYDVKGRPNDLWRRFRDSVSLYLYSQPNLNSARPDALTALTGQDLTKQQFLSDYLNGTGPNARRGPRYFKSTEEANALLGAGNGVTGFGVEIRALRIRVKVRQGVSSYVLTTVIAPPGGARFVASNPAATSKGRSGTKSPEPTPTPTPAPSSPKSGGGAESKKLNYPFTLLEISENVEPPSALPPEPVL